MPDTPNVLEVLQGMQSQLAAQQSQMLLRESLEDSGLPVEAKRELRKKFSGKSFEVSELDEAIEAAQEKLKESIKTQESKSKSNDEETETDIVESAAPKVELKPAGDGRWVVLCEGQLIVNCATREEAQQARQQYLDKRQYKIQESIDRIEAKYMGRMQEAECKVLLKEKMDNSGLPSNAIAKLEKDFKGRIFQEKELDDAINQTWDLLNPFLKQGEVYLTGQERPFSLKLSMGESEYDRLCTAFDGFWAGQDLPGQDGKPIRRFRHISEAYTAFTKKQWDPITAFSESGRFIEGRRYDSHGRYGNQADGRMVESDGRFKEALQTSSWAQIMGDSITRRMLAEYAVPNLQTWRALVSEFSAPTDFRTQRRMRVGGYGLLPVVLEGQTYTPLPSPTDQEALYDINKRGGLEVISMEMLANDSDTGALRRIPSRLGRAAAQTLYRAVFDVLDTNPNLRFDDDTTALFTAGHNNLVTGSLDAAGIDAGIIAMKRQTAYGNTTEVLGLSPRYVVHPTSLRRAALQQIETSPNEAGTVDNQKNSFAEFGMQRIQVDYFASQTAYYLVSNVQDAPTMEVGFFRGNEDPEIFVADQENTSGGSMMESDQITYKIRHIWGVGILDWRSFIKIAP
jgi:hypothetical protein